jgi:2,5-diketo-D-gluconate reductase A
MTRIPSYPLNDGNRIPAIGFGTYPLRGANGEAAIVSAIEIGYRLVDTAVNYLNEREVGRAIARSGVPREELQIATKLPGRDHGYERTLVSFEESRIALGLEYVDLYLIHWPNPSVGNFGESWRAMVELRDRGVVRSIGVSNFTEAFLTRIYDETGVMPAVNQVELHPFFPQVDLRAFHEAHGIRTESWSPLGKNAPVFQQRPIVDAAERYGVTPAQVVLRWHVQLGAVPIPKSADPDRQRSNLDVFGFELADDELAAITALGRTDGRLFGGDPLVHEEM